MLSAQAFFLTASFISFFSLASSLRKNSQATLLASEANSLQGSLYSVL